MDETKIPPALNPVIPLPYRGYKKAGGIFSIFSKEDYDRVVHAATGAMNGEDMKFEPVHIRQTKVFAEDARLSSDQARDVAFWYAFLREAAKRAPDLAPLIGSRSDQEVYAQALLMTGNEEAYRKHIRHYPNIFKPQA